MIQTNTRLAPAAPTAAKMTTGVHGGNIREVADSLARDSATLLGSIDSPATADLTRDVQALKTQLWARLSDHQMTNALMTAGALMGGPHGLILGNLRGELKSTLASPDKLDALAAGIAKFDARAPREASPPRGDVYASLGSQVKGGLVREQVDGPQVPVGTFLAGALANAYQDHGGYHLAG